MGYLRGFGTMIAGTAVMLIIVIVLLSLGSRGFFPQDSLFLAGGLMAGSIMLLVTRISQVQEVERGANVIGHVWCKGALNGKNDQWVYLLVLRNIGLKPGRSVVCIIRLIEKKGTVSVVKGLQDITDINIRNSNEKVYQFRGDIVYPDPKSIVRKINARDHNETAMGKLVVNSDKDEFSIHLTLTVEEETAISERPYEIIKQKERSPEVRLEKHSFIRYYGPSERRGRDP